MAIITCHGYRKIFVGYNHHLADSKGYAYEHRLVAEQILERPLQKGEEIHHINGNKIDNRKENIEIFKARIYHRVKHRGEHSLRKLPDEQNPKIFCKCGCGNSFYKFDNVGRFRQFLPSHNSKKGNKNALLG